MANFKHKETGSIISLSTFQSLPSYEKGYYGEVNEQGDFLTSLIVGAATDSFLLGGLIGGSMLGGLLGDSLGDSLFD